MRELLCKDLCPHYKGPKGKEYYCMGYIVLEKLMKSGRDVRFDIFEDAIDASTIDALSSIVCATCEFRADGCDFAQKVAKALPCGGFTLLGHLIQNGLIDIDDIRNVR